MIAFVSALLSSGCFDLRTQVEAQRWTHDQYLLGCNTCYVEGQQVAKVAETYASFRALITLNTIHCTTAAENATDAMRYLQSSTAFIQKSTT